MNAIPGSETLRRRMRTAIAVLGFVAIFIGYTATVGRASFQPKTFEFDLMAFYCGGTVVAERRDPYLIEPLRTCEHAHASIFRPGTQLAVPVPLPAYDFVPLAALSRVPYPVVRILWIVLELAACLATALLLARTSGLAFPVVLATLVVSDFYCSAILGQLAPFALLGIVLAGHALEKGSRWALLAGLLLAMLEPHLGLPIVSSLLVWSRRRGTAAIALLVLAVVSLAAMPIPWILEYATRVLPAQALSEANNQDQFGSLYFLHALGLSESSAFVVAKINYALTFVAGVAIARRASRDFGIEMLAFAPVTFVLIGGPYLHVTQIAAAIPAALTLAGRSNSRAAGAAATLLTIPWLNLTSVVTILPIAAGALLLTLRRLCLLGTSRAVFVTCCAVAAELIGAFAIAFGPQAGAPHYGRIGPSSLPETTWKALMDLQQHGHPLIASVAKLPTQLALLAIVVSLLRRGPRVAAGHTRAFPAQDSAPIGRRIPV